MDNHLLAWIARTTACVKAAMLIEVGSERYGEDVRAEANRIYKGRFMAEMNKARNSWHQKDYDEGIADGRKAGIAAAETVYMIRYPCAWCGGDVVLTRNGEDTRSAIDYLKSQGWRHKQCNETSKQAE